MTGILKIFLQIPTIALLLHRLSHVTQCVYVLTKALFVFILLLKIAYVELRVGEKEACTCVTYIATSNNGSMGMTNHTSWSRLCTYVEGGWWKLNTPFMNLSLLHLDNMMTWIYYCIYFLFSFSLFFFMGIDVSIFFGSCFLGMPSFF